MFHVYVLQGLAWSSLPYIPYLSCLIPSLLAPEYRGGPVGNRIHLDYVFCLALMIFHYSTLSSNYFYFIVNKVLFLNLHPILYMYTIPCIKIYTIILLCDIILFVLFIIYHTILTVCCHPIVSF